MLESQGMCSAISIERSEIATLRAWHPSIVPWAIALSAHKETEAVSMALMVDDLVDFEFLDTIVSDDGRGTRVCSGRVGGVIVQMERFQKGGME